MQRIKGFTEDEVRALAEAAERAKRENGKLSEVFAGFADEYGRAKGSVRNFYYEFMRMCEADENLRNKFFTAPPKVNRARSFSDDETRRLVRDILSGKRQNKSVRKTIIDLAEGDEKRMLRYQNKYRNVLKNAPELVAQTAEEMGLTEREKEGTIEVKVPEITLKRLKSGINTLVENIARSVREENAALKRKNALLEQELFLLRGVLKEKNKAVRVNATDPFASLGVREEKIF